MSKREAPRAKLIGLDLSTGTDFGCEVWGYIDRKGIIHVTRSRLLPPKVARPRAKGRSR